MDMWTVGLSIVACGISSFLIGLRIGIENERAKLTSHKEDGENSAVLTPGIDDEFKRVDELNDKLF
jgi:hypothetical protein